ncbi:hypothetical protein [Idiomarina sp.]|uniref:hypothetical protein n=1 Tax=Idiomarina sp. TaxID=1874361 RepID=UPI003A8F6DBE
MKQIIAFIAFFIFTYSSYAADWCAAPDVDGYYKTVQVCDNYPETQETKCNFSGKLWGDLGGYIVNERVTYSGNVSCDAKLYIRPFDVCEEPEEPTDPNWDDSWPEEPVNPAPKCDSYSGDIPLFNREVVTVEGDVIPGSCRSERVWIRCN